MVFVANGMDVIELKSECKQASSGKFKFRSVESECLLISTGTSII